MSEEYSDIDKLIAYLKNVPPGEITGDNLKNVFSMLCDCWDQLDGSNDTSMNAYKLDRATAFKFFPPHKITFEIERHGAVMMGSIYAEIQGWIVELENKKAYPGGVSRKKAICERDANMDVCKLAEGIANDIINRNLSSQYLQWKTNNKVHVIKICDIIPHTKKQTTQNRRKKFRDKLEELISKHGWKTPSAHYFYELTSNAE